jgi:hypothetical protein
MSPCFLTFDWWVDMWTAWMDGPVTDAVLPVWYGFRSARGAGVHTLPPRPGSGAPFTIHYSNAPSLPPSMHTNKRGTRCLVQCVPAMSITIMHSNPLCTYVRSISFACTYAPAYNTVVARLWSLVHRAPTAPDPPSPPLFGTFNWLRSLFVRVRSWARRTCRCSASRPRRTSR